ncbi:MAG TPA: hypothetical protein VHU89_04395 [Acidobacteriaceae bacterium]|jgi:hypothetical protein|nr:hypothetical protein [Acidobacteriaceae bacterium]
MHVLRSIPAFRFLLAAALVAMPLGASGQASANGTILHAAEATRVLPDSVYFAGKSASTQLRNSAGVRYGDGHSVLAVLVDTSGYSSSVQQKYQGYLLSEVPLEFGSHRLAAGAWGIGFVGSHFDVMDIGNHDALQTAATHDATMPRPMPLQILEGSSAGSYRLCFGRDCVEFHRAR